MRHAVAKRMTNTEKSDEKTFRNTFNSSRKHSRSVPADCDWKDLRNRRVLSLGWRMRRIVRMKITNWRVQSCEWWKWLHYADKMIKKLNPRGIQGNMTLYDSKNNNTKPRKRLAGRNARMYKKSAKRVLCINYQKSELRKTCGKMCFGQKWHRDGRWKWPTMKMSLAKQWIIWYRCSCGRY